MGENNCRAAEAPFRTCPYCGASLDPGEICDCTRGDDPGE